jgi:hypothetical protein
MIPCITSVLMRLKADWVAQLQPDAIMAACQEAGYIAWRDRREHTIAPPGIANLAASLENRFRLQERSPLSSKALEDSGNTLDHGVTSCTIGVFDTPTYRRCVLNPNLRQPHRIDHRF